MSTVELIEHLTNIFLDLALPAVVLWIGWQLRRAFTVQQAAAQAAKAEAKKP